jgi:hypothetical protein
MRNAILYVCIYVREGVSVVRGEQRAEREDRLAGYILYKNVDAAICLLERAVAMGSETELDDR